MWLSVEGLDYVLGIDFGGWGRSSENIHDMANIAWGAVFGIYLYRIGWL
jgi:hypothetical protein